MEVFFLDDSAQKGARPGMGTIVAAGGVFVEAASLRPLSAAIDAACAEAGIPDNEEVKWSPKKGSWIHEKLHGDARQNCYSAILKAATEHKVRAAVVCWDTGRTNLKLADAFARAVGFLFERITVHLTKRDSHAIVVADRPGGGKDQEEQFLSDFLVHVQEGTEYVVPDRVLLNVLTTPSHMTRHLQVADLVTGIATAMVCGGYKFAPALFDLVRPLLIRNHMGGIAATGLKVFPNDLINLYHWVLKEDLLHKGGGAISYTIPTPKLPYAKEEFTL